MVSGSPYDYVEIEPTGLINVPILKYIEMLRLAILRFIWKDFDIKGFSLDNALKAGIIAGVLFPIIAATFGNLVFSIVYTFTHSINITLFFTVALVGMSIIYFYDYKFLEPDKSAFLDAVIGAVMAFAFPIFLITLAPIIGPLSQFTSFTTASATKYLFAYLTTNSYIVHSAVSNLSVTITLPIVIGSVASAYSLLLFGRLFEYIIYQVSKLLA